MKKTLSFIAVTLLLAFLTSCMPAYQKAFWDAGDEHGWTEKQKKAAWAYADRAYWSREVGEQHYVIMYNRIPTAKVREQLEGALRDLDGSLDPKNAEMAQYLSTFNLRKDMEHDETVLEAVYTRVHASELQNQFDQLMGDSSAFGEEAKLSAGYSARKIFVNKSLAEAFPFKSEQIEGAKKEGLLKPIEHVELDLSADLDHKEANPANPDDANDYVWKAKKQAVRLINYKIVDVEKPENNKGNYIEGYRVLDGKQEASPSLRIFFPQSGSMAVVLLDTDAPGEPGYGVPNILTEAAGLENVQQIIRDGRLLEAMFAQQDHKKNRIIPEIKLFKVEIARLGDPIDPWEKSVTPEGWIVPFKYKNERGDNYNVRVHYKKIKIEEGMDHSKMSEYMELEYIEKEYTRSGERYEAAPGQVIEYFHPKKEFAGKLKATVEAESNTKKLSLEFEDGTLVEGLVTPSANKFVEDAPYAKSYTEGQKRWWIETSDGKKFEKRKSVGPPKESTGVYSDEDSTSSNLEDRSGMTPMDMMNRQQHAEHLKPGQLPRIVMEGVQQDNK